MAENTYDKLRQRLLAARNEILRRSDGQRKQLDQQVLGSPGDLGDASVVDENADYYLSIAAADRAAVGEINEALARMRNGTYGKCESCGFDIDIERLERLPQARLCLDCQTAREAHYSTQRLTASRKM